ncbi:FAS1-like dehydratase domain-containing protein [Actinocrinis sp.]|uniref:FAS1-like dehydratase domain-containing protein n=1 Tax=Actinocrinis sp. TaxID=1920516 RepID=UPI002DDDA930|nr:MaoC family dehydratase N-terminal domain-containing protein [Actinocrinis sp.]
MTRERITEFTEAIGAASPAHHSPSAAARTLGHPDPDVIAPPAFATLPPSQTQESVPQGNPLGCDPSAIHLSEDFQRSRPITAGDVPVARAHIAHAREATDGGLLTPEVLW